MVCVLNTACSVDIKTFDTPVAIPDAFSLAGKEPLSERWWLSFNDNELNRLIDTGLAQNLDLHATLARLDQAKTLARKAGSELIPAVDGVGNANRRIDPNFDLDNFTLALVASYEVDLWRRIRAGMKASELDVDSAREDIDTAAFALTAEIAATSKERNYTSIPPQSEWNIDPDVAYVHYTSNETIGGVEFQNVPEVGELTLVADKSSNILSRPFNISRFGVIYAGAQKNLGPAGISLVIVREDLIGHAHPSTPSIFNYQLQADAGSMLNTPPTFNWYLLGLVLEWLQEQGGIPAIEARNIRKAEKFYAAIDASSFYSNPVDPSVRSRMNVLFLLANKELEKTFTDEAKSEGLVNLEGHRSVGGLRASLNNAVTEDAVNALIAFLHNFERKYG